MRERRWGRAPRSTRRRHVGWNGRENDRSTSWRSWLTGPRGVLGARGESGREATANAVRKFCTRVGRPRATDWKIDDSGFVCSGRYGCEEASRHAQPCLANARRAPSVAFAQPPRAPRALPSHADTTPARAHDVRRRRSPSHLRLGRAPLRAARRSRARRVRRAPPCRARAPRPRARCHHPRGGYHPEGHQGRARGDDEGARPDPTLRTTPPPSACQHLP